MAVDPEQYKNLSQHLNEIIHPKLSAKADTEMLTEFEELLIDEVSEIVIDSRPPRIYVFGRSGAGKSSLINALVNGDVADVGTVEPTTVQSDVYDFSFPDQNGDWEIVDSRGLFESIPADGDVPIETVDELEADLAHHNPDILLHVMTPGQVRAGENDFAAVKQLESSIVGGLPPRILCLNKVDLHLPPSGDWPPEQNQELTNDIVGTLELVADILSVSISRPFVDDSPVRGLLFDSEEIIGAFPTYVKEEPYWNLTTLIELLCEYLPTEALLQFAQSKRRERLMRQLARKQTEKTATAVGQLSPDVVADLTNPVITSYQRYLVALIGSFSGAELGAETIDEYFEAIDSLDGAASILATTLDRAVDISLSVLGTKMENLQAQTYGIGRSAEAYFFDDELIAPKEFRDTPRRQRIANHLDQL
jgi:predicted GTPase